MFFYGWGKWRDFNILMKLNNFLEILVDVGKFFTWNRHLTVKYEELQNFIGSQTSKFKLSNRTLFEWVG